jgi:type IV pilus assembly protein PilB
MAKRLGQILIEQGRLTEDQLWEVLETQKRSGEPLGRIAVEMGLITEKHLAQALGVQLGMKPVDLPELTIPPAVIEKVPETMASVYKIIPISFEDDVLTVAMAHPQHLHALDDLRNLLGYDVRGGVSNERDVQEALERYYQGQEDSIEDVVSALEADEDLYAAAARAGGSAHNLDSLQEIAEAAPVRKLLNMILLTAIRDQASDVHLEPFEDEFKVRIRADGVLYELLPPPRHLALALVSRVKVMANLDIAERRLPQDGRIELNVGGNPVDLRVSVLPTMFGESVVMRVLDRTVVQLDLNKVGMDEKVVKAWREVIYRPNGIVLNTGPTGAGKTTTLYASLNELNEVGTKIITTEDPVEYDIEGLIQIPINPEIEVTFSNCLRGILRHDPDKILVGEIRDYETAEIAVQSSLTGHIVFSTLHTNAVFDHGDARGGLGAAARAADLHRVPHGVQAERRTAHGASAHARAGEGQEVLSRARLRPLQQHRL